MGEFDTRNKKPTVINIAGMAVILVLFLATFLTNFGDHTGIICAVLLAFFLAVLAELIAAFVKQLRYNPYSYNTIYYIGFAFFVLSIILYLTVTLIIIIVNPGEIRAEDLLRILLNSAKRYMMISAPFILVFSVALTISNLSLLRHEGKRFKNVLGIILAVLLVAGEIFLFLTEFVIPMPASATSQLIWVLFINLFAAIYLYFECMVIGATLADIIAAKYEPKKDRDFLIILGCSLQKDGRPTPLLRGRCDRAVEFSRRQKEETGKDLTFITSGGQGSDEIISESASMKRYLIEQGIPEEQIIEENQSENTFQNMEYSKAIIQKKNPEGLVAFSTTNYHVFRSGLYARRLKMRAVGMGAPTKWYFWPNAGVREFVGLIQGHKGKQAAVLGGLIACHLILTLLAYR